MSGLENKIVLVTGGSGGIGQALAWEFTRQRCRVAIAARRQETLLACAEEIARHGGEVLAIACDVTDRQQVKDLGAAIGARWGAVQILINNAGIARAASFTEMADELWDEILATNLTGTYNCCKVFLPEMLRAKWGRIINIGSTTAKVGYRHVTAYTASKHGLLGLTRSLALETARQGVTVNMICPGYVDDERTRENAQVLAQKAGKSVTEILQLFAASAPQQRLIEVDEVSSLAALIASEKLGGMTGQAISVDGGATMV